MSSKSSASLIADVFGDDVEPADPPYFGISPFKLIVMCMCTFNLYMLWWEYVNWCRIRERDRPDILPAWRAIFGGLWLYPLMSDIRNTARTLDVPFWLPAGPLTIGLFVTAVLIRVSSDAYFPVVLLGSFWLWPAQVTAIRINAKLAPHYDLDRGYRWWEIAILVVGGLIWALALFGFATEH